jgi:hypothetical protein
MMFMLGGRWRGIRLLVGRRSRTKDLVIKNNQVVYECASKAGSSGF